MKYMCELGNCESDGAAVMVSDLESGTRKWFCTRAHAVAYLMGKIEVSGRNGTAARESAQLAQEGIVKITNAVIIHD